MRCAINGFGRIGRSVVRALFSSNYPNITLVAINELADIDSLVYLLRHDSVHGHFLKPEITIDKANNAIKIGQQVIKILKQPDLTKLDWAQLQVDVVLECSGINTKDAASVHIKQGASKVLISNPATADVDATIVYGFNEDTLRQEHKIISNSSCTTNCCIPIINELDRLFQIERGAITTIHSLLNDQQVIDSYNKSFRLMRAANESIIPVDTRLAKGIDRILPNLAGKFEAISVRVPTVNVSVLDVCLTLKQAVSVAQINNAILELSKKIPQVVGWTDEPLVSIDFNGDKRSVVLDGTQTKVSDSHLVKLLLWFDNETAYAHRLLDVVSLL